MTVRSRICCLVVFCCLASVALAHHTTVAQGATAGWSAPLSVVAVDSDVSDIALAADSFGGLHVLYSLIPASGDAATIEYISLGPQGWSVPNSIVLASAAPSGRTLRAVVDARQNLHLLWVEGQQLYHASAPADHAGSAPAWTSPHYVAQSMSADLIVGPQDDLLIAHTDTALGAVLLSRSSDGGVTWSPALTIAICPPTVLPSYPRMALDEAGRLHLVWTEGERPQWEPLTGVYYTRSLDGGTTWEPPRTVDGFRHGEIGVASVGADEIHLIWRSNIGGDGTFHQWSPDGGDTWSVPDRLDDRGGMSGLPSFAVDAVGRLHWAIGPVKYAYWDGHQVSEYQDFATEAVRAASERSVERGALTISGGNVLHAVFEVDFRSIWYTSSKLDVSGAVPSPTPLPETEPELTPTLLHAPTPAPTMDVTVTQGPGAALGNDRAALLLGSAAGLAAVGVVVAGRALTHRWGR